MAYRHNMIQEMELCRIIFYLDYNPFTYITIFTSSVLYSPIMYSQKDVQRRVFTHCAAEIFIIANTGIGKILELIYNPPILIFCHSAVDFDIKRSTYGLHISSLSIFCSTRKTPITCTIPPK